MKNRKFIRALCAFLACVTLCGLVGCRKDDPSEETTPTSDAATQGDTTADTVLDTAADTAADTTADTDPATTPDAETAEETPSETETEPEEEMPSYTDLDFCHYNYECVKSVNEVEADGIYHVSEWDEAYELIINNDTLQDWGRWQAGPALDASEFSISFRLKWDEEYLYLLEIRTDKNYVYEFEDKGYDAFSDVWGADATAFFLCDAADTERWNRCDIGYFTYVDKLNGPSVYVGSFDGEPFAFRGPSGTEGCTYGGSYDGKHAVFEMKLPWAIIEEQGKLLSEIKVGTLFRFNPILPSVDTTAGLGTYGEEWRQLNFHDCIENGEGGDPDDPYYWAAMTLVETLSEE